MEICFWGRMLDLRPIGWDRACSLCFVFGPTLNSHKKKYPLGAVKSTVFRSNFIMWPSHKYNQIFISIGNIPVCRCCLCRCCLLTGGVSQVFALSSSLIYTHVPDWKKLCQKKSINHKRYDLIFVHLENVRALFTVNFCHLYCNII